jgi:FHS family glucose/mannose:H+ symporter-like MFS transporter
VHTESLTDSTQTVAGSSLTVKGTALVHADFIITGVVMTVLGPMLPMLSARWLLNDAQAGYLFVAQFVTSMFGMLSSGILVQRFGYRRALMVGLILMAVGMVALTRANLVLGLAAVSIYGFGFGSNTPAGNLFSADANPGHRAAALNWVNASWGIGAMGCPLLVAWAQRSQHVPLFLYGTAAVLLALVACLSWVRFAADEARFSAVQPVRSGASIWNPRVLLVAALFFTYVGTETSTGGWVASYARRLDMGSHAFWAVTPSFFWGALLAGRLGAPLLLRRMRETTVASLGLVVATAGIVALLAARSMTPVVIGASLAGLGLASIFPISVSMLSHWFGEIPTRVSGAIFAGGNLGGAALPWLVGALSTHFGGLRTGFFVPLVGALIMLVVYLANGRRRIPEPAPASHL